jgi:hypothetical protein
MLLIILAVGVFYDQSAFYAAGIPACLFGLAIFERLKAHRDLRSPAPRVKA